MVEIIGYIAGMAFGLTIIFLLIAFVLWIFASMLKGSANLEKKTKEITDKW